MRATTRAGWLLLTALALSPPAYPQERRQITVEWANSDEGGVAATAVPRFAWTSANDLLLLDVRKPKGERTLERADPASGARKPALDRAAAFASLEALLGKAAIPDELKWPDSLDRAGRIALYVFEGDLFALELAASRFTRLTRTPEPESVPRLSPDGRKAAFVRGNDLYVADLGSRAEARLTVDGGADVLNGTLSWVYWEEVFDREDSGYWWSEDSSAIAFLRTDESRVSLVSFPGFAPAVPRILTQRYPKAGEANPEVRLGVVDVGSGKTAWLDRGAAPYEYVLGVRWLPDSRRVAVQVTNRMQTRLDLYFVERADGKATRILTDTDDAWVNQKELQFLDGGKQFLLSSERDGQTHLYLYAADGKLVRQVTRGPWSVRGPGSFYGAPLGSAFVDESRGLVYFTGLEKSSIERQLYRVRLDGSGLERVSREDGTHRVLLSPDRRYHSDVHSAHASLPSLSIRDASGATRAVLAPSRSELIAPFGLLRPDLRTVPAADGFPLPARLLKPRGFDPGRRYPVILYVYCGPGAPTVNDSWDYSFAGNAFFDQVLADRGYVVASIDNRSATGISKTLENTVLRRAWSDGELDDVLAGVAWLKAQPWVDKERVGIWGWSGGGTSTLLAMTRSREFKAGIAVAPNVDWRYYDTKFSEAYMKTPADNPEGYAHTSLIARAKDLHGRLLLVHGSGDDNVHPQHAWHLVDELVAAGKPFDLMIYPMRKHPIDDKPARIHLLDKMLEFWKLYL